MGDSDEKEADEYFRKWADPYSFLQFAVPVLLALILQAMYGAVDLAVVGEYGTAADLSAVSTGSQLMSTVTNVIAGLAMGTTVLLGQKIGQGEKKAGEKTIGTSGLLFLAVGCLVTLFLVLGAPMLAKVMRAPEEASVKTISYIRICGGGALIIISYNLIGSVFRGMGDAKTPLLTVAIACVVNVCGDLL